MYENIQKYLKMCKIENHINYCVFLMILNFWEPAFRPKIAQTRISIDSIEPPGTFPRIPRIPFESLEVVSGSAAQGPPPHAPGARMTVV